LHAGDFGVRKLEDDVVEVRGKTLTKQSLHILKYEESGPQGADSPDRFGKHVTVILVGFVLAAQGKGLARWTAGNQVDGTNPERSVVELADVSRKEIPSLREGMARRLVEKKGGASVRVAFNEYSVSPAR